MKFNKIAKKFAAAALAGVLMVSSMGISASAATTGVTTGTPVTGVTVTKNVNTDGNTYAPNTTFTFTVTPSTDTTSYNGNVVTAGVKDGLTGTTVTFSASTSDTLSNKYSKTGTLKVDASVFSAPGVYHYTVTEETGSYDGITYNAGTVRTYDVYLYVYNDTENVDGDATTDYYVGNVVVVKDTSVTDVKDGKSDLVFENDYGANTEIDSTHDVTITKNITGDMGDENATFTFKVTVASEDTNKIFKVVVTRDGNVSTTETYITAGTTNTYEEIGKGDTIQIYGITSKDTVKVEETEANQNGYETTYSGSTNYVTYNTNNDAYSIIKDAGTITVTNNKDAVTPTGIALSIAPYVLMVAFAGVIAVLFLRKRKYEI